MSLLDDVVAVGRGLAPELKPVEADLVDAVAGIVAHLEQHHPTAAATATADVAAKDESGPADVDETIGSKVFDVAGHSAAAETTPPAAAAEVAASTDETPEELQLRVNMLRDELQHLEIKLADAQKTQHIAVPPLAAGEPPAGSSEAF